MTINVDWVAISAVCAVLVLVVSVAGTIFAKITNLHNKVESGKDEALNSKLDAHFTQQKDTLARVDQNITSMGRILEGHMAILNDHSTRLAVAETRIDHLDHITGKRPRLPLASGKSEDTENA